MNKKTVFVFCGLFTSFILHGMKKPESHDQKGIKFDYQKHGQFFKKTVKEKSKFLKDKARYISYEGKKIPLSVGAFNDSKELRQLFDIEHSDKDTIDYGYAVPVDTLLKGRDIPLKDLIQFSFFSFHVNKVPKALEQGYLLHLATAKKLGDQEKIDAQRFKNLSLLLNRAGVDTALNLVRIADILNNQKVLNFLLVALSQKIQKKDFLSQDTTTALAKMLEKFGDEDLSVGFSKLILDRYPQVKSALLSPTVLNGRSKINGSIPLSDKKSIATWHEDGSIALWDVHQGKRLHLLEGHTARVNDVKELPLTKNIVSISNDGNAIVWDLATGKKKLLFDEHVKWIRGIATDSKGYHIATYAGKIVKVWSPRDGKLIASFDGPEYVSAVFVTEDGRVLSGHEDGSIVVWDSTTSKKKKEWKSEHVYSIKDFVPFSGGLQFLVRPFSGKESKVSVLSLDENKESLIALQSRLLVRGALPFPGNKIVSTHQGSVLRLWNITKPNKFVAEDNVSGIGGDMVLSRDKNYFFTIKKTLNQAEIRNSAHPEKRVKRVDFGKEKTLSGYLEKIIPWTQKRFIAISSESIGIWDMNKMEQIGKERIHWDNAGDSVIRIPEKNIHKAVLVGDRYLVGWAKHGSDQKVWDLKKADTLKLSQLDLIMRAYLNNKKPYQIDFHSDDYKLYQSLDKRMRKGLEHNKIVEKGIFDVAAQKIRSDTKKRVPDIDKKWEKYKKLKAQKNWRARVSYWWKKFSSWWSSLRFWR